MSTPEKGTPQAPPPAPSEAAAGRHYIVGTAGHIDHGKTSLVKALTGVDTDRLKEEKERGITIELGFAPLDLPGGRRAGLVDVPGHERFVKTMVAGAFGVDLVLLVVAADEGVMPQTREHTDICSLLGIERGVVALTKADLVDPELLELAVDDVRGFLRGSFLEEAEIIPVSALDGRGLDALRAHLARLLDEIPEHDPRGVALLPVDRCFTMKGFGTVVTGTTVSGGFTVGDAVEVLPAGVEAKIRGVQVHGQAVEVARVGQRTALNLGGVAVEQVPRGSVLAAAGRLSPTRRIDATVRLLPQVQRAMKHRASGLFYTGTAQSLCTVLLQDRDALEPGQEAVAQILLESEMVTLPGERFILRGFTTLDHYGYTIGGGQVLDPLPTRRRGRKTEAIAAHFAALRDPELGVRIEALARAAGIAGLSRADLDRRVEAPSAKVLEKALGLLLSRRAVVRFDVERGVYVHGEVLAELIAAARARIADFHAEFPAREGIGREELRTRLHRELDPKLFAVVIGELTRGGEVVAEGTTVRLASHQPRLGAGQQDAAERIARIFEDAGLTPPLTREVIEGSGLPEREANEVLRRLTEEGRLERVKGDLYFDVRALAKLKSDVIAYLRTHGEISTGAFKDLTHTTRKYAIPLSEYLDRERITLRVGDVRRLRAE